MEELTPNQLADLRASEAARARLGDQPIERLSGWDRLAAAVRCPKREPLDMTPRQLEKDNAWAAGWRVGFYTTMQAEDKVIVCPFEDVGLSRSWSAGLLAGESAREKYEAEFGIVYPNALEMGNKPFLSREEKARRKAEREAAKQAKPVEQLASAS